MIDRLAGQGQVAVDVLLPRVELLGQFSANPFFLDMISRWQGRVIIRDQARGNLHALPIARFAELVASVRGHRFITLLERHLNRLTLPLMRRALASVVQHHAETTLAPHDLAQPGSIVIGDVFELEKPYFGFMLSALQDRPFFSINHGVDIDLRVDFPQPCLPLPAERIHCFLFSELERPYFRARSGLPDERLHVVGIHKHDPAWIALLDDMMQVDHEQRPGEVLLIGRPHGLSYLTRAKKRSYLDAMRRQLIDQRGFRILVKRHPKEKDLSIYREAFGPEGRHWQETDMSIHALASRMDFCLSFYSGVCTDLIMKDRITIEYLHIDATDIQSEIDVKRMPDGSLALSYRYFGLVLAASDADQFARQVEFAVTDRAAALGQLRAAYDTVFERPDKAIDRTLAIIRQTMS